MKRLILSACAALMALAAAGPSFAADLPRPAYKAPAYVAPAWSWTGFYVGANGGYAWGDSNWSSGAATTGDFDIDGYVLGGTLGYNLQTGVWVWGIEGDFNYADVNGSSSAGLCAATTCTTNINWMATVRGRIGYSFDRFMPYITGGAAFADVETVTPAGSSSETAAGWVLGAGIEWAFLGAWSAKLEYLYTDLGDVDCSAPACGPGVTVENTVNLIRAGINYRF